MADEVKQKENTKAKDYYYAHGRHKEATARVRLNTGRGQSMVNDKPVTEYFPGAVAMSEYLRPFLITKTQDEFYAQIKVEGSGKKGQLKAAIHGVSWALNNADDKKYHSLLKKAGLLTRDPRVKERRKYGRAQKARKGKQSPKR